MSDENTITKAQFDELQAQLTETTAKLNETTQNYAKLQKIFDERQTKVLDKEGILAILGKEKAPEKPIADVIAEMKAGLEEKVKNLTDELGKRDAEITLNAKKSKVADLAKTYNFIDSNGVISAIDYTNDDLESQVKALAEKKPHWINKPDVGKSFSNLTGLNGKSIEEKIQEAYSNGDVGLAMTLKRQAVFNK